MLTSRLSYQSTQCLPGNPSSASVTVNGARLGQVGVLIPLLSYDFQLSTFNPPILSAALTADRA
jgi:hypothetical protein